MKKRIAYSDEPLEMKPVEDFLPSPDDLIRKEGTVKVTLSLTRSTVDFFKTKARHRKAKYQRMIRRLLDQYASRYS